ncbi:hypothetical protein DACRYDRAFT_112253 [Dacryopinax primogenitus]|uniref:Uncharacterized protein n=1 Tax=Dacryopinax primogenitus (strain DJM 731) TaxID=1858805 RepID=M5FQD7_DACPD|nr:uncharacterized protein DACRYDRAFT_112253 [Dacryopinax primogenitus]EJT96914.1 hypothetical protein DACRYDRAFT_112253 [Dacryopinax primogenitus]
MSSPQPVAHITFKRARKSGNYLIDKSYPVISPYRVSPSRSRRRHSSVIVDSNNREIPNLDSLLLTDSSRAQSRARSVRPRQSVRPVPTEDRQEEGHVAVPETETASALSPPVSSIPAVPQRATEATTFPTPVIPPSTPFPAPPKFNTAQELITALSFTKPDDLPSQRLLTERILFSSPSLPLLPPIPLLTHTITRLLTPSPLPLLPQLLQLLSQLELHRQLLSSQGTAALSIHAATKGPGKLGREARRRLREVAGEKVGEAQRRKWWVLTLHLRKTYIREQLTLNPFVPPDTLLTPVFPSTPSLSTVHLSPLEASELSALKLKCSEQISAVSLWARHFTGTPAQAQASFDIRWPMSPDWKTTVDVVRGYCKDVQELEGVLTCLFGDEEEIKFEPLEVSQLVRPPKLEPASPAQPLLAVFR